jgi:hypothetical protein
MDLMYGSQLMEAQMNCPLCGSVMEYTKKVCSSEHSEYMGYDEPLVEEWHKCLSCGYSEYGRSEID